MKRLLIILLCLPLIFACTKEEPFVEGEEIVLNMSVCADGIQTIATRAMADNVVGTPALWLVVFDNNGQLVEYKKAYNFSQTTINNEVITSFKVELHATLEGRIIHFLLNYVDNETVLELNSGHENNVIGGLTVERDRDVYWQRVVLPNGINNNQDDATNTVKNYLTKVPLVRNFSRITVLETADDFELLGFYVLNVPKYGTVAPFHNGEFVKYHKEDANFNGQTTFTTKSYQQLDVNEGYRGTKPNVDERINRAIDFVEGTTQLLDPKDDQDKINAYYLYENTYINGDENKTVSVLLKGKYNNTEYWYRVDLVKENTSTGVFEYFDILRNFSYNIKITHATAGKTSAKDAIEHPAGNNVLSSLDIAHLTNISDGTATLEVNHTDTVLISRDEVYVRYKFTDNGTHTDFTNNTNEDIKNNVSTDDCGWYLTHTGAGNIPINVSFATSNETTGEWKDWRKITVTVNENALKEREEVTLTLFAKTSTGTVLSRTVSYTLLPQQKMLVECPTKVPGVVGSPVDVSILIPDGLPEAMFPLDFAIEAQGLIVGTDGNVQLGTDNKVQEENFLIQRISPHKNEVMTVRTAGSIVPTFAGKKSFQYMVTFSYEDYLAATTTTRQLNGVNVLMRVFTKKFITNTATSASRVYAYNKYFYLGSDNFINGTMKDFTVAFANDQTVAYGVGRTVTMNITAGEAGRYLIESNSLQPNATRAVLADLTLNANETRAIALATTTFAGRGKVLVTCGATGVMKEISAAERKTLNAKIASATYNGSDVSGTQSLNISRSESEAHSGAGLVVKTVSELKNGVTIEMPGIESEDELLYFSYVNGNKVYIASATVGDLIAGRANLVFDMREIVVAITDLALSGSQYYGENRDVTLTFNVTKTGTYTITCTEGTGNNATKTYTHNATSIGQQTVSLGKTRTWGEQLNVTVSTTIGGVTYSESIVGVRDVVIFGKIALWCYWNDTNNEITIILDNDKDGKVDNGEIEIAKVKGKEFQGVIESTGGWELKYAGLKSDSELIFTFYDSKANVTRKSLDSEHLTISYLMSSNNGHIQFNGVE